MKNHESSKRLAAVNWSVKALTVFDHVSPSTSESVNTFHRISGVSDWFMAFVWFCCIKARISQSPGGRMCMLLSSCCTSSPQTTVLRVCSTKWPFCCTRCTKLPTILLAEAIDDSRFTCTKDLLKGWKWPACKSHCRNLEIVSESTRRSLSWCSSCFLAAPDIPVLKPKNNRNQETDGNHRYSMWFPTVNSGISDSTSTSRAEGYKCVPVGSSCSV